MFFIADLNQGASSDALLDALEAAGCENLMLIEESDGRKIICSHPSGQPPQFTTLSVWTRYATDEVDWTQQWSDHVPGFDGEHLKISCNGREITLKAGAGFGDTTHPTTQLMLEMLPEVATGLKVLDLGCGSGILSFAAAACGAVSVMGMDIDPAAIAHATENLQLNPWANNVGFTTTEDLHFEQPFLLLLNMIPSEQALALASHPRLEPTEILVSGVLAEQCDEYLEGSLWELVEERERDGWLALRMRAGRDGNS